MENINMDNLKDQNIDELNNLDKNELETAKEYLDKVAADMTIGPEIQIHGKCVGRYLRGRGVYPKTRSLIFQVDLPSLNASS
jgi:hypothetical protein